MVLLPIFILSKYDTTTTTQYYKNIYLDNIAWVLVYFSSFSDQATLVYNHNTISVSAADKSKNC